MENRLTRSIYDHSPVFLQNLFSSLYGWRKMKARYGAIYHELFEFFGQSASWSAQQLQEFQNQKLQQMVRHAYEHTAFYRERMDAVHLGPDDIRTVADLSKLPLLNKEDIRASGSRMLSDAYRPESIFSHVTSGSTGLPMTLHTGPDALQMAYAFHWARRRPGVKRGDPYASFTGLQIVRPGATRPPFWRDNWAAHQRMYSIFHMNDRNLVHYVRELDRHAARYLDGYPSPVYLIAEYIERTGQKFGNYPQAVFSTSEELQPHYRETIERVLRTKVWDSYGQGEFAASITEYSCGHLHYDMDYGVIEFIEQGREDGLVKAEVVCTGLYNYAWPLIRYRVGDLVLYDPTETPGPACANQGRIIRKILGRTGQYFVLPDGTRVTNISVIAKKCRNIVTMQVLQKTPDRIELLVQKGKAFVPADEQHMLDMFAAKVGGDLKIDVRYVNEPLLSRSGKFLSIISQLDQNRVR